MRHFTPAETDACRRLLTADLADDLGTTGDRTSLALIPPDRLAKAAYVYRKPGVVAGLPTLTLVAEAVHPELKVTFLVDDGTVAVPGLQAAIIEGPLISLLAAERTSLNFLQHLSGVATLTQKFVDAVSGYAVQILDTRKTVPGWRPLEKYAVRQGGGHNHRLGLHDAILIKDNHLAGLGDPRTAVARAIELARAYPGNAGLPVEIEVDSLDQLETALVSKPEIILLDNMTLEQLRAAVERRNAVSAGTLLEASGGVDLSTVRAIAATGVERISVGALTHSAPALDVGLDFLA